MSEAPIERNGNGRKGGVILRFWGVTLELRGLTVLMSAVLLVVGTMLFGLFWHDRDQQRVLANLLQEQVVTTQTMQEFTYVITLPQDRREALRLQMPPSLRKKMMMDQQ